MNTVAHNFVTATMDVVRQVINCLTNCFNCKEDAIHQVRFFIYNFCYFYYLSMNSEYYAK